MSVPCPPPLPLPSQKRPTQSRVYSTEEVIRKAEWNTKKRSGDGLSHSFAAVPLARLGIFVMEKVPHERKFDGFAFLLSDEFQVTQLDADDILSDGLQEVDTLVLPGGLVADYESKLGQDGRKKICEYIYNGGCYYGVCAGAFYAGSSNYLEAQTDKKLVGVEVGFHPGLGEATVQLTGEGSEIFGCPLLSTWDLYFSNGCLFQTCISDTYLSFTLPKAQVMISSSVLSTCSGTRRIYRTEDKQNDFKL